MVCKNAAAMRLMKDDFQKLKLSGQLLRGG